MKRGQLAIYTMDLETDPFAKDKVPVPFVGGLYDGLTFWDLWTDKHSTCLEKLKALLEDGTLEPGIIYMHNGGRFDFFYLLDWFEGKAMIIGSRIVRALMPIGNNHRKSTKENRFEFRDSYAIMPFPLADYKKDHLPIEFLERSERMKHVPEIRSYLKQDCVGLWELCMEFQNEFGDYKTIASASFAKLNEFHQYEQLPLKQDAELRSRFYFGGRVQCFQKGVIESPVTIYDVNSMYPYVMDSYFHPTGWIVSEDTKIHGWNSAGTFSDEKLKTFFLTVTGHNRGAFAQRMPNGSVDFTQEFGTFYASIHEWKVALELGLFEPTSIDRTYNFYKYSKFHLFVDHFYKAREKAKIAGDKMHSLFYKYILNSAYGKFGLNPENYKNWEITKTCQPPKGNGWEIDQIVQDGKFYVWKQPSQLFWNVKNIGTAASITGGARSVLLRAIAGSKNVLYCDTDSILCETFADAVIDDKKLGAWKPEGTGLCAAIAGKKMYAVFDESGNCIKHANKGLDLVHGETDKQKKMNLSGAEILRMAQGELIFTYRDAPTFKRDGSASFITRTARMT